MHQHIIGDDFVQFLFLEDFRASFLFPPRRSGSLGSGSRRFACAVDDIVEVADCGDARENPGWNNAELSGNVLAP